MFSKIQVIITLTDQSEIMDKYAPSCFSEALSRRIANKYEVKIDIFGVYSNEI